MKINIYYGGRGMIDDPTITVINRMTSVLEELRVNVELQAKILEWVAMPSSRGSS